MHTWDSEQCNYHPMGGELSNLPVWPFEHIGDKTHPNHLVRHPNQVAFRMNYNTTACTTKQPSRKRLFH
jgi:hypothetical protein